ncbi:MAG: ferrous iron transport protein A, partial [Firmicutes bacterium]|nr:ferrous iron transport protein A [Bacillota bacterium]
MTLLNAQINKTYRISRIRDGDVKRRLLDMGFTPGSEIYICAAAPFGGAVLVGVRGFCVALRADAAGLVELTNGDGSICQNDKWTRPHLSESRTPSPGESCQLYVRDSANTVVSCQLKEDGFVSRIPKIEPRPP